VVDRFDLVQKYKVAEPLLELNEFKKIYLGGWQTLAWPCSFELDPESLYERATGKPVEWITN